MNWNEIAVQCVRHETGWRVVFKSWSECEMCLSLLRASLPQQFCFSLLNNSTLKKNCLKDVEQLAVTIETRSWALREWCQQGCLQHQQVKSFLLRIYIPEIPLKYTSALKWAITWGLAETWTLIGSIPESKQSISCLHWSFRSSKHSSPRSWDIALTVIADSLRKLSRTYWSIMYHHVTCLMAHWCYFESKIPIFF